MTTLKRIIVVGATGLIGTALCKRLHANGYAVVVFARNVAQAAHALPGMAEYHAWTPSEHGAWAVAVDYAHAVINLAGASVASQRWTEAYKRELGDSRIIGTRGLVNALAAARAKPAVFVSGSAVGYYGTRRDAAVLDESAPPGSDFLAQMCVAWEAEAAKAEALGIRTAMIRTGIVLDKHAGALPQLMQPFKLFAGGPILPGTQWVSWIHLADEVDIIVRALEDERVRGPINATAPIPQMNKEFAATLGKVMGRPSMIPVPGVALKVALGEFAESLTTGQRAVPQKMLDLGYQFQFGNSEAALRDILG